MTRPASAPQPAVSVVICAYTMARWDFTLKAIESIRRQSLPVHELVVVVDHNAELLARFKANDPTLTVIGNAQAKGLSGGRNTGIQATTGEFVAFLDDDAEAEPTWLEAMLRHFERPEVIGVGSRVDPDWVGAPRAWFPAEFLWVMGCSYRGLPEQAAPIRNVSGGAMVLRRLVFERAGEFSLRLGRTESKLPLGGEETELCMRAQERIPGSIFIYEPGVAILHHVSTQRMTWSYLGLRCYAEGLSKATLSSLGQKGQDSLASERRHTLVVLPRGVLRGLADALLRQDLGGLGRAVAIVYGFGSAALGYLAGRIGIGRPGKLAPAHDLGVR